MSVAFPGARFATLADLRAAPAGLDLGHSPWRTLTQADVDRFAEVTGDRQWIHVDVPRARLDSPYGGPVVHGALVYAVCVGALTELLTVEEAALVVNAGVDRLRYRSPVPVGADVRVGATLRAVAALGTGLCVTVRATLSVRDVAVPACVADLLLVIRPRWRGAHRA